LVIVLAWLAAARSLDSQFTPLVKKDLKSKYLEGKLSAATSKLTGSLKAKQEVSYRFMSGLNDKGFIEGKYVPIVEDISTSNSEQKQQQQQVEEVVKVGRLQPKPIQSAPEEEVHDKLISTEEKLETKGSPSSSLGNGSIQGPRGSTDDNSNGSPIKTSETSESDSSSPVA